ncbi:MAG: pentapeptide repeat-containing protein [Methanotrichaceae archaeon]|nr:pentapeptide repeat-containing protein [Methanotrichaceae archaeon]
MQAMTLRTAFILSLLMAIIIILGDAKSSPDLLLVPAEAIISQVRDGQPVYYESVSIAGDLNLDELAEMPVKSTFVIINSTVQNASFDGISFQDDAIFWGSSFGNVSFNGTGFSRADFGNTYFGHSSFMGATFSSPVSFDGAVFQEDVSFVDSRFMKDASFVGARFLGDADFNYTIFGYYAYFSAAEFAGNATFSDVLFQGDLDFYLTDFKAAANFFGSDFDGAAGFSDASFEGPAGFGLTRFSGLSSFGNTTFSKEVNFNLAHFSDAAYFSGARFQGKALFGLAKFEDIASMQGASFEDDLNLNAADISTMLFEGAAFGKDCRISLNDSNFARLKAPWGEIKDHVVYNPGAFLALVENYHGLGWSRDEDDCYYDYRRINQAERDWGWMKLLDAAAWLSCGYGVRPGYAVLWSLLTIAVFALIFWIGDGIRRSSRPFQGAETDPVPERATLRNALFFSTMIFLSQGPIDFLPVGRHRYYVILEGILGWLLLALFLVTLGRVMIR